MTLVLRVSSVQPVLSVLKDHKAKSVLLARLAPRVTRATTATLVLKASKA